MNFGALMGMAPSIVGQAQPVQEELEKKSKKEGIAKMLGGIGKGHNQLQGGLPEAPRQQEFDVQSFLAQLFGG